MGGPQEQRLSAASLVSSLVTGDERFAVTGASGWLGRTALELLLGALGTERFHAQVTGLASTSRTVLLRDRMAVRVHALDRLTRLDPAPTHILHFAYLTRDRVVELGVPAYVRTNLAITATVVDAIARCRPQGVFVTSSGAVYEPDGRLTADIDANPYGTLKHMEELAVRRAVADGGGRSVITRVFSLTGAYMTKPQRYALGDMVLQALAGGPITVRAGGRVERSYCAAVDVVALALACLLRGGNDDLVFDSGGEVIEIGELAVRVRDALALPALGVGRSWDPNLGTDRYVGDPLAMQELAVRHGLDLESLDKQIRETVTYLAEAARTG